MTSWGRGSWQRRLALGSLIALLAASSVVFANGLASGSPEQQIELSFLNQTYRDLDPGLVPIQQGPLRIEVASPQHRVQVFANRLAVRPTLNGTWMAVFQVELDGDGHLQADVGVGGSVSRWVDNVVADRQWVEVSGEIRVSRNQGGYVVGIEVPGPSPKVEIQSALGQQIVTACQGLALLLGLDCDGLDRALSVVQIPLPEPGSSFLLSDEYLNREERAFFDVLAAAPAVP